MQLFLTMMPLLAVANAKPTFQRRAATCGSVGYDKNSPNAYYFAANTGLTACAALCAAQTGCNSIATGQGNCLLYTSAVADNFVANAGSAYTFNDLSCIDLSSYNNQAVAVVTGASSSGAGNAQTCAPVTITASGSPSVPTTVTVSGAPVTITASGSPSVPTTVTVSGAPVTIPTTVTVSGAPVTVSGAQVTKTVTAPGVPTTYTATAPGTTYTTTSVQTQTVTKSFTSTATYTATVTAIVTQAASGGCTSFGVGC